jgi:hypothetical protein
MARRESCDKLLALMNAHQVGYAFLSNADETDLFITGDLPIAIWECLSTFIEVRDQH